MIQYKRILVAVYRGIYLILHNIIVATCIDIASSDESNQHRYHHIYSCSGVLNNIQ